MPNLLTGAIGSLLIVGGLAMIFVFPDATEYQSNAFSYTGIAIGGIMVAAGIALLVLT